MDTELEVLGELFVELGVVLLLLLDLCEHLEALLHEVFADDLKVKLYFPPTDRVGQIPVSG